MSNLNHDPILILTPQNALSLNMDLQNVPKKTQCPHSNTLKSKSSQVQVQQEPVHTHSWVEGLL